MAIGSGGTMGVNVANGDLHLSDPDVRYSSEGYATEVARSYNSLDDNLDSSSFGTGGAWRLNMGEDELLYPAWWDGSYALHQSDGSYTRFDRAPWADGHPAAGDKAYTDEAYVGAGLVVHENGTRTLTYPGGTEWQYDNSENGFPQKIVDPGGEGNTISLSYTSSHLTKVTDTHSHELELTREAGTNYITKIAGKETGETWKYTYKEGRLTTFTNPAKEKAKYTYYKSGPEDELLESIADESGTWVIVYDSADRVSSIRKLVNGSIKKAGSEDEITTFAYETEQTTATNPEGGKGVYYYDQFGNVVEDPEIEGDADSFYAEYAGIENTAAKAAVDLQAHSAILDSQLTQQLGGNYTGEWLDPSSGHLMIGLTSGPYEQTVEQDLDNLGLADNAEIVTSTASWTALEAARESLQSALGGLIASGLVTVQVELERDGITVEEASGLTSSQTKEVSEAVGSQSVPVRTVVSSSSSLAYEDVACSNGSCPEHLRGGVGIHVNFNEGHQSAVCTAGFITESTHDHKPYLLTAGHCLYETEGSHSYWTAKKYGTEEIIGKGHSYVSALNHEGVTAIYQDEGLIEISPSSPWAKGLEPWIITYGNSELSEFGVIRDETYEILGAAGSRTGFVVCTSGVSGLFGQQADCGKLKGGPDAMSTLNAFGEYELQSAVITVSTCNVGKTEKHKLNVYPGMSGSPVYRYHKAYGVVQSVDKRGCTFAYQDLNSALQALHVSLKTGP